MLCEFTFNALLIVNVTEPVSVGLSLPNDKRTSRKLKAAAAVIKLKNPAILYCLPGCNSQVRYMDAMC